MRDILPIVFGCNHFRQAMALRDWAHRKNLKWHQVADLIAAPHDLAAAWFQGDTLPTGVYAIRLADLFNRPIEVITNGRDNG